MTELTIVAKDRVGLLADISDALAKDGINIEFVSVEATSSTAIVHLKVANSPAAKKSLTAAGFRVVDKHNLLLRLKDRPGELAKVSRKLADAGINIKNVYILDAARNEKIMAMDTSDNAKARTVLKSYL